MFDLVGDMFTLVLGPRRWRDMSGPAVVAGIIVWSVVGAVAAVFGLALVASRATTVDRITAWVMLAAGVPVLGDVIVGTIAFFRGKQERT